MRAAVPKQDNAEVRLSEELDADGKWIRLQGAAQ